MYKHLVAGIAVAVLLCPCLLAPAQAKGCKGCGSAIVVFSPNLPAVEIISTPFGEIQSLSMQGNGGKIICHCDCLYNTQGQPLGCVYTMEFLEGSGHYNWSSGGCIWRWMDIGGHARLCCIDVGCTGDPDIAGVDPHL